jgi:Ferritin-like domain
MKSNFIEEVAAEAPDRRRFLRKMGVASAAVMAGAAMSNAQTTTPPASGVTDAQILTFALNLEYLEAEFYTLATTGTTIDQAAGIKITGSGTPGPTTGGQRVVLVTTGLLPLIQEIAADEQAHVKLLQGALTAAGVTPIAKPAINLGALGFGFVNQNDFLELARIFEDIGVTAYEGAAGLIQSNAYLQTAAEILGTEAYHAGALRTLIAMWGLPSITLDGVDYPPPPSGKQYFPTDANALVRQRTTGQVLYLAYGMKANATSGGFFPNGVNGTINTSSASA